jgi:sugar phosphate isomerase/epimerase
MGIVVHSYGIRWQSKAGSQAYPGFKDALDMMQHCHRIGAGGIQVGVNNWSPDFCKKMREFGEKNSMFLEASIALPKSAEELPQFEKNIISAKEAGISVVRTVCLGGRRYETFKTLEDWNLFKKNSLASLQMAVPVVEKHKVLLAVENHKDWHAAELVEILKGLGSNAIGACLDFGNNLALLEDPNEVIRTLAPYSFSTHVKDMGVQEYENGFLLSEVPLGQGIVDLKAAVALCKKHMSNISFCLEMITRDPLKINCLDQGYYVTFEKMPASQLITALDLVKKNSFEGNLPATSGLNPEQQLAFEEQNILDSLSYSQKQLGLA